MSNNRYHPLLVSLHWLIAVMLILALLGGTFQLQEIPNDAPEKIGALKGHMIFGITLLVLTLVRLAVKVSTSKPPKATTGNSFLDKLGVSVHHGFYLLIILMAGSGIGIAILAGLPDIVFGGSGAPLPKDFFEFPPRIGHAIIAKLLMLFVLLHIAGVIYHQFKLRDGLLSRMWFGK